MAGYGARIEPDGELGKGYISLLDAIKGYERKGQTANAVLCREILAVMWAEYEALSIRGAAKGTQLVRARIRSTQVRPDASGRLLKAVESHPLPSPSGFPGGAVGIASLDALDKGAVNPRAPTKGEYWRAQEHGTTAHVGRKLGGFFGDSPTSATSPASQAEFRSHPYFVTGQKSKAGMVIQRPLIARHFVRDGAYETGVWHAAEETKILNRAVSAMRALR